MGHQTVHIYDLRGIRIGIFFASFCSWFHFGHTFFVIFFKLTRFMLCLDVGVCRVRALIFFVILSKFGSHIFQLFFVTDHLYIASLEFSCSLSDCVFLLGRNMKATSQRASEILGDATFFLYRGGSIPIFDM
jgi:hypothetical protein